MWHSNYHTGRRLFSPSLLASLGMLTFVMLFVACSESPVSTRAMATPLKVYNLILPPPPAGHAYLFSTAASGTFAVPTGRSEAIDPVDFCGVVVSFQQTAAIMGSLPAGPSNNPNPTSVTYATALISNGAHAITFLADYNCNVYQVYDVDLSVGTR
jgi:hypothetical protein